MAVLPSFKTEQMPFMEKSQSSGKAIIMVKKPFAFRDKFLSRRKTFEIVVYLLVFFLVTLFILLKTTLPNFQWVVAVLIYSLGRM